MQIAPPQFSSSFKISSTGLRASDSVYFLVYCVLALGPDDADSLKKVGLKGSPYSISERRVPELIPVLGSQSAGDVNHKPGGRLPLLSARPAVTPATLNYQFCCLVNRGTMGVSSLPKTVI